MWSCPGHEDRNPSLSVTNGNGRVLVHDHGGCPLEAVLAPLGLNKRDLFEEPRTANAERERSRIVATYDYVDEQGTLLYQVVRLEPKGFRQRRPDGNGGWIWNLKDTRRVLYRLPEVLDAVAAGDTIHVCEGEKDVDALRALLKVATCSAGGAGSWRDELCDSLRGAEVVIVADKDKPGRKHARQIYDSLQGLAASIRIVEARTGNDASDHLKAGHSVEELIEVDLADWTEPEQDSVVAELLDPSEYFDERGLVVAKLARPI
jgi:5S rRNA maturation endonuclease (ribonuclease M5)